MKLLRCRSVFVLIDRSRPSRRFEKLILENRGWVLSLSILENFDDVTLSKRKVILYNSVPQIDKHLLIVDWRWFTWSALMFPPQAWKQNSRILSITLVWKRYNIFESIWKLFSFLKKNSLCCILECTEDEWGSHSSLSSMMIPRYLYWWTIVTVSPLIEIGNMGSFLTLKSIINSYVFLTLRSK